MSGLNIFLDLIHLGIFIDFITEFSSQSDGLSHCIIIVFLECMMHITAGAVVQSS